MKLWAFLLAFLSWTTVNCNFVQNVLNAALEKLKDQIDPLALPDAPPVRLPLYFPVSSVQLINININGLRNFRPVGENNFSSANGYQAKLGLVCTNIRTQATVKLATGIFIRRNLAIQAEIGISRIKTTFVLKFPGLFSPPILKDFELAQYDNITIALPSLGDLNYLMQPIINVLFKQFDASIRTNVRNTLEKKVNETLKMIDLTQLSGGLTGSLNNR